MTDVPPPQGLSFPCIYPVKAMGLADEGFEALVLSIVRAHVADLRADALVPRLRANGKYVSVTIEVEVASRAQLEAIYSALHAREEVLMTL